MEKQSNPYLTSWFQPKTTIDEILNNRISFTYQIPIILAGLSTYIGELKDRFEIGLIGAIFIIIIGTGFMYLFLGIVFPWIIIKIGKIWNGTAEFNQMQKIIGLAQIPIIIILIYQSILLIFGQIRDYEEVNYTVQLIVWLFSIRILIIGIAKAQQFSYGFALLNIALSFLPFLILRLLLL